MRMLGGGYRLWCRDLCFEGAEVRSVGGGGWQKGQSRPLLYARSARWLVTAGETAANVMHEVVSYVA